MLHFYCIPRPNTLYTPTFDKSPPSYHHPHHHHLHLTHIPVIHTFYSLIQSHTQKGRVHSSIIVLNAGPLLKLERKNHIHPLRFSPIDDEPSSQTVGYCFGQPFFDPIFNLNFAKSGGTLKEMASDLKTVLSKRTEFFHLKLWDVIGIFVALFILIILLILSFILIWRKKSRRGRETIPIYHVPIESKEIREISVDQNYYTYGDKDSDKPSSQTSLEKLGNAANIDSKSGSLNKFGEEEDVTAPSPLTGLPEVSHLGWGHWFTLRDLEIATKRFSKENVIGEGGYGVVYRGNLVNGTPVAVKRLLNNLGQAEKEFSVEVEAIGNVRHKNLVRLLGYCIEGTQRLMVYEYVNNGNLDQWLHGAMSNQGGYFSWEARMKVLLGTAKALSYLHEAIEPKVVHRDIKSSNILIDEEFNAKISDFGLAKLLGAGKSHVSTRVMGTFGYVAPEYANSGLLNEKSDVYSFGVVLLETITGRDPVDYSRQAQEVNLVDWLKMMVGNRRSEEVVDPNIENRPSTSSIKRALLIALRCVDPDSEKRPKMSQVARMLESEEHPIPREDRRKQRSNPESNDVAKVAENDTDKTDIAISL